ncbi:MAG TPA: lipid-binding SYLF domain-containing protein [Chthoniobacterales bacterium]
MKCLTNTKLVGLLLSLSILLHAAPSLQAASRSEMRREARAALSELYETTPAARNLGKSAKAVLVFPQIVKAGFILGAQHGDGTLLQHGKAIGCYKTVAGSYGLQAGVQKFGYALFFMTNEDLAYLRKSGGWEIGTGPSVVIVDKGMAKAMTSTTLRKGVYAFAFSQKGLMAGLGLQGTKITPIRPD